MSEQWPAGYDFLFRRFFGAFALHTAAAVSDGIVVPEDCRVEALILIPDVIIAGVSGLGTNVQVKTNQATAAGPTFNLPEGAAADKAHLIRPEDFVDYAILAGSLLQVESDGEQVAATTANVLYIVRPI